MKKNITLSAEEELIKTARQKAQREHSTLNHEFRQWLLQYVHSNLKRNEYQSLMQSLSYAKPGKKFSRDEMNER
ncbi:MAG: hypothetical protein U5R06_05105 [candidate division KSB1 bacterium]|nr:hypothetical protein [candidate division KSB1 bacterium]